MKRKSTLKAIFADWSSAVLAWACFYIYRKLKIEDVPYGLEELLNDSKFRFGILVIPVCWVLLYAMVGYYKNVYRKSRLHEVGQTLWLSVIGVLIIFFSLLLDDKLLYFLHPFLSALYHHAYIPFGFIHAHYQQAAQRRDRFQYNNDRKQPESCQAYG